MILMMNYLLENMKNLFNCLLKRIKEPETFEKIVYYVTVLPSEEEEKERKFLYIKKISFKLFQNFIE